MKTLQVFILTILLGFISCDNTNIGTNLEKNNVVVAPDSEATLSASKHGSVAAIPDSIRQFKVDDYPITNEMLLKQSINNPSFKVQSGKTISYDKVWFNNDTLKQTLVLELYTDYHKLTTYHFHTEDIPVDLLNKMELHSDGGELASESQKSKDLDGFVKQATRISSFFLVSEKGFGLGDKKQKAIEIYGSPDKSSMRQGVEKLEWNFIGDTFYTVGMDLNRKPLAEDSYGHQVSMYFRNNKLIGLILHNEIP